MATKKLNRKKKASSSRRKKTAVKKKSVVKKKTSGKKKKTKKANKKKSTGPGKGNYPRDIYKGKPEDKPLNSKEQRFVDEYIITLHGTKAAILAGYSSNAANVAGSRLLSKANIQKAVNLAIEERQKRTNQTADRVIQELVSLAYIDTSQAYEADGVTLKNIHDMPEDLRRAISGMEVITSEIGSGEHVIGTQILKKLKIIEKTKALDLLGKHHKLFTENHVLTGPGGIPLAPPVININFTKAKK